MSTWMSFMITGLSVVEDVDALSKEMTRKCKVKERCYYLFELYDAEMKHLLEKFPFPNPKGNLQK